MTLHALRLTILSPLRLEFGGGFERFCLAFAREVTSEGGTVTIATWDWLAGDPTRIPPDETQPVLDELGIAYAKLPVAPVPNTLVPFPVPTPAGRARLRELLGRSDIVYFNNAYFLQDLLCAAGLGRDGPPVISAHHSVLDQGRLAHDATTDVSARTVWHRFDAFHALNERDADYLRSRGLDRVYTIPIPVDPAIFAPAAKPDHEAFRLLYLGRLDAQKGLDTLLAALSQIARTGPPPRLRMTLAGDGPLRPAVAALAASVPWITHVVPREAEKVRLYQESDLLVMPSRRESFGIVAAEAMLCGLPLLATRNPGSTTLLREGETGLEIPDQVPAHLADRILRAAELWNQTPATFREMGRKARDAAAERFAAQTVWPKYVSMLHDVAFGG